MKTIKLQLTVLLLLGVCSSFLRGAPVHEAEFIFPLEHWHNHGSCLVEAPNGDLIVCWFNGSGERTADDVKIEGARKRKGERQWSERFTMADTPAYPDTNCAMFIDPQGRLWLLWPTILANQWETALMKYKISTDYQNPGVPKWKISEVLHVTPDDTFLQDVNAWTAEMEKTVAGALASRYLDRMRTNAADKLTRRLGWMTRAHPVVLKSGRILVPLYSDGFSFSLMAFSDDLGATWRTSRPLIGGGNIQPSVVQRKDGSLYTLMRDNGLPPKRLHQSSSSDQGETWTPVTDSVHPNPGAGAEIITLQNGNWVLIGNDTERGRQRLLVQMSDDEGKTWKWKRYLEKDEEGPEAGAYHYPSIIQSKDGFLHATYSFFINKKEVPNGPDGKPARKTIKYARFNEDWLKAGD
jgi:predicted neuraminidase